VKELLHALPSDFPTPIFIVIHVAPTTPGLLDQILARATALPVHYARDGQAIEAGHVYLASPDHHLILEDHVVRVTSGPKHNRYRPAIDPLFRSAALAFGPQVCGVVLSGMLYDGTMGLYAIKEAGGIAIVQSPEEALHAGMPLNALDRVNVDYTAPVARIAQLLIEADDGASAGESKSKVNRQESIRDKIGLTGMRPEDVERPLPLVCPECGGVLSRDGDGELAGFRCFLGHTYSEQALWVAHVETAEALLWKSLRALTEVSTVGRLFLERERQKRDDGELREVEEQIAQAEGRAAVLRGILYDI
jgi:two-component system chemotaxis response regulator CheB